MAETKESNSELVQWGTPDRKIDTKLGNHMCICMCVAKFSNNVLTIKAFAYRRITYYQIQNIQL